MKQEETYNKSVAIFLFVVVSVLSFLVIRPFVVAILSAAALAFLFYPFFRQLRTRLPDGLAALLTTIMIVVIVLIPVIFISVVIGREARDGYLFLQSYLAHPLVLNGHLPEFISQRLSDLTPYKGLLMDVARQMINWLQGVLLRGLPNAGLNIMITVFSLYYLLKNGKNVYQFFLDFLPLPEGKYKKIIGRFDDLSRGMVLGQVVVGLIQGFLAWAGFVVLGVPNPVLWGFATALISIIPLLGAAIVWLPIALFLIVSGYVSGEYWKGVALLAYGSLVISTIDNFLKPKIVGDHAKIHPLVILFGILGGIQLFGIAGILIGPMVLTILDVMIEVYREVI